MKIRFPSGDIKNYNHSLSVIRGLLAANFNIHPTQQFYFLNGKYIENTQMELDHNQVLDLAIGVLSKYAVCNQTVVHALEKLSILPLVTPSSQIASRKLNDLNTLLRFYNGEYIYHKNPELEKGTKEKAMSFYEKYDEFKTKRLKRIKEFCDGQDSKTMIISTFNHPYTILFKNFIASCKENNINIPKNLLIFPMDQDAHHSCRKSGIRSLFMKGSYGTTTSSHKVYGDGDFRICMFMKNAIVKDILDLGYNVLFMDMDMIWLKNPLPYLTNLSELYEYDFMFMFDGINPRFQPLYYNSGFFYIRNTDFSRQAWNKIFDNYDKVFHYGSQQMIVNMVMNVYREKGLRTHLLDPNKFVNGHQITPNKGNFKPSEDTYAIHASWTAGIDQKIRNLKSNGLWYL